MNNFEYYAPTKIVFGVGEFENLGREVNIYGKRALLVEQNGPLDEMGVFDSAISYMKDCSIDVFELKGVESNPKLSKIEEGIDFVRENNIEVIVAVGGGSTIDTAKAIAFGSVIDVDVWDYFSLKREIESSLPVVAVSTISATGAETSMHCVVTNDRDDDSSNWQKWAVHSPYVFPKTAVIDPILLKSVPKRLTAAGMADTISHIIEGYFDGVPNNPISDRIGEGIVKTVIENDYVLDDLNDLNARSNIAWASTLAMSGLQDCGRSNEGFPAHWIQHAVGAMTDSSHGEGLAVINPAWLILQNEKDSSKFVQFTKRVFNLDKGSMSNKKYGLKGIELLKEKFASWGLPSSLSQLGVKEEMIMDIVDKVMNSKETYIFDRDEVMKVLKMCLYNK
ncbi:iron-containing alcohol dehydrogenase [Anaerofustis stercorihominis]|uniref:Iron-containing alcohol dehydrogenase n=1 Tax=Anaerofustis stercorihominis TaxID=214853 RepID=A0A3E3E1T9_9FIRM|nr:iron-containing alcohol dehydrogenase [Anaerofustis stercorihominis]RGD75507.1 iron-containing alcohol dehydrogenase [Anaerofustis stercorihominis]